MSETKQTRIEVENAFIARHRLEIARFGPGQFSRTASRGAVLVQESALNAAVAKFLYLTVESMAGHGLLTHGNRSC